MGSSEVRAHDPLYWCRASRAGAALCEGAALGPKNELPIVTESVVFIYTIWLAGFPDVWTGQFLLILANPLLAISL